MKRSEMIKFISKYFTDEELFSAEEIAATLLSDLEEKGMLPPFSSKAAAVSNQIDAPGHEWDRE